MSILIKGMKMPVGEDEGILVAIYDGKAYEIGTKRTFDAIELPPHGDLIDRNALIKDGWLNLHKEVMRMGGYAIHELPLKNPSIPVIIEAEEVEE